ncbi:hypothetical protein [Pseudoalteromonas sp. S16_S37]|uniref:hypothetical protein n=1 Tax=Pseudoalteromonas sp. S16_S37 TaxID=2720228 RepID=UPI0016806330|nr:hypothetical protein [Pseudoalteromonas sp. S16_S37]MBD1582582.1 hypothetical protein [Pseudoalteromonas sp. S16_S37]
MAASTVAELNVLGDTATFTLSEPKTHTIPSCVSSDNQNKWAINLNSLQGQAMYSLLVTAVSKEQLVTVQSAQRCESVVDVEQVQSLSLSVNKQSAGSGGAWLYKGDGVTKVGKVISFEPNVYYYSPIEGTQKYHVYKPSIGKDFQSHYFLDAECKSEPYQTYNSRNEAVFYQNVKSYFHFSDPNIQGNRLSDHGNAPVYKQWGGTNGCVKESYLAYQENRAIKLEKTEHPLCGKTPCWIK